MVRTTKLVYADRLSSEKASLLLSLKTATSNLSSALDNQIGRILAVGRKMHS
jgi:hypothetical protein